MLMTLSKTLSRDLLQSDLFMFPERFDKIISSLGFCSLRSAKNFLQKNHVCVNSRRVDFRNFMFDSDEDELEINGKKIPVKKNIYLMMNKPAGIVCSKVSDSHKVIYDLLKDEQFMHEGRSVHTVGRLDADTEGLIFLTDNGSFSNHLSSPQSHVEKTYRIELSEKVEEAVRKEWQEKFYGGITIPAEKKSPEDFVDKAVLTWLSSSECQLKICQGKFHQVRRMVRAMKNEVKLLTRIAIGNVKLDPALSAGSWRFLTEDELAGFAH